MFPVLLYACVFISGGSALAYELYWTRLLELSIGHTVYAFTTAVAAFMGGSALGSRFMGPWADRSGRPVRFYALLELGIGAYGLLAPHLLELIRVPLLAWHAPLGGSPPAAHPVPVRALLPGAGGAHSADGGDPPGGGPGPTA